MGRAAQPIVVTRQDRAVLEKWVRAGSTPQRLVTRARIVLLASGALSNRAIAERLSVSAHTVQLWRERFERGGTAALRQDAPGRGRKPRLRMETIARVQQLLAAPREDGRRWTIRSLADATGVSRATIDRICRTIGVRKDVEDTPPARARVQS